MIPNRTRAVAALLLSVMTASCSPSLCPAPERIGPVPVMAPAVAAGAVEACPSSCPEPPAPPPGPAAPQEVATETAEPPAPPLPPDYELDDIRTLPQELGAYTAALSFGSSAPACREGVAAAFRKRYFSPWDEGGPISDLSTAVRDINKELGREWYGENRRRVPRPDIDAIRMNCDLGRLPSFNRRAITVVATSMRVLPTARPFYKQSDSFPFDMMQQSGVKLNEPLRVLHLSRDGLWVFAESSYASGWIDARDVAYPDETAVRWWRDAEQVVIVRDHTSLRDTTGNVVRSAKIGTLLPLVREAEEFFEVYLAARSEQSGGVVELLARVPKEVAQRHPLPFTGGEIARIGNQMLGTPYGWGELFNDRDCSALVRDFYLPFGLWLPRGSYDQGNSGTTVSLNGKSPAQKARLIMEQGVPFRTLVWLKGHIMLYVGIRDGKPLVLHDYWGPTVKDGEGKSRKQIVGKAVVSTLTPGSELTLAGTSLLAKVGRIRILNDLCPPPAGR